ncbi:MAG: hypothetical protein HY287_07255 [Planctomycetes bacterium]|nr:hypothetical protein [Planctomycetota bacterium]
MPQKHTGANLRLQEPLLDGMDIVPDFCVIIQEFGTARDGERLDSPR